jgi:hypothetical protein
MAPSLRLHSEIMQAYQYLQAYERLIPHMTAEEREDLAFIADFLRQVENGLSSQDQELNEVETPVLFSTLPSHVD